MPILLQLNEFTTLIDLNDFTALTYSHLSNKRGGWNKRGGGAKAAKAAKSVNVEAGILQLESSPFVSK
jgi:hypothetical protein